MADFSYQVSLGCLGHAITDSEKLMKFGRNKCVTQLTETDFTVEDLHSQATSSIISPGRLRTVNRSRAPRRYLIRRRREKEAHSSKAGGKDKVFQFIFKFHVMSMNN